MPAKRTTCMYCGGAPVEDEPSFRPPVCVSCKGSMKPHPDPETPVLHCKTCNSLWFGRGVLEQHLAQIEVQLSQAEEGEPPVAPIRQEPQQVEYRKCPSCDAPMKRENYRRVSGVIIDRCQRHGTFLDAGELEALIEFIQTGGEALAENHEQREAQYIEETERRSAEVSKNLYEVRRARSSRYHWGGSAHLRLKDQTTQFTLWDMLTGSGKFFD